MTGEGQRTLRGVDASPGIAIGRAMVVARRPIQIAYRLLASEAGKKNEILRFRAALESTKNELTAARDEMDPSLGDYSYIIEAHLQILQDKMITSRTEELINAKGINAEWALDKAVGSLRQIFAKVRDGYLRARFTDVEHVTDLLLSHLTGHSESPLSHLREKVIVVASDLSPSDTSQMDMDWVMGFVTDVGGPTGHTAIMAQAKAIPAVVGLERISQEVQSGEFLVVDGQEGVVIINPSEETLHIYREKQEAYELYAQEILAQAHLPADTADGRAVGVEANVELAEEVSSVITYGAEGIGLYRTEFFYISQPTLPSEEELYQNFRIVAESLQGRPVNIRTLDLGGDKLASSVVLSPETNPALGLRAIRYCLKEKGIFKDQLRALLRASAHGHVRALFPMISGVGELLQAKQMLFEAMSELDDTGQAYESNLEVGIMIEVPSAVAVADLLAPHVDFFSIGTNDLIQYSLAIDRVNEHVAHLYQPFHPAVLRMIQQVVKAGHAAGIPVAMCGEMAGDPRSVPLLLGLGLDGLSVTALAVPRVKQVVRATNTGIWRLVAKEALSYPTAAEVHRFVEKELICQIPEVFSPAKT